MGRTMEEIEEYAATVGAMLDWEQRTALVREAHALGRSEGYAEGVEADRMYAVLYGRMAEAARACGYALAVHGSMVRDLDVVAIPWTEAATSAEEVVNAMAGIVGQHIGGKPLIGYQMSTAPRPHGRRGFSIPFPSEFGGEPNGYVDVSVMPRSTTGEGTP